MLYLFMRINALFELILFQAIMKATDYNKQSSVIRYICGFNNEFLTIRSHILRRKKVFKTNI